MRQSTELAVGVLFRVLTVFMGRTGSRGWCASRTRRRKTLPCTGACSAGRVEFGHEFNGIVCNARDLDVPNPGADPVMARYARQLLEASLGDTPGSIANDVRQLVLVLLPAGHCRVELVAQHLGVTGARCSGSWRARARPSATSSRARGATSLRATWTTGQAADGSVGAAGVLGAQRVFALASAKFRRECGGKTIRVKSA